MQHAWLEKNVHWLQQKTGIDMKYMLKNGSYVLSTQFVAALTGIIQFIIVGRWLPGAVYGQYKYFLSLHSLFAIFTLTGMDYALGKAVANNKDASTPIAIKTKLTFSLIGSGLMFAAALYQYLHHDLPSAQAFLLIGCLSPWIYAFTSYSQIFIGKKKFNQYARAVIFSNITTFIPMIVAFWLSKDPVILFAVFLLSNFTNVLMYFYAKPLLTHADTDPNLIPFAKHVSLLDVLGTIANAIDSIIVYHLLGPESLAIYSLAILPVEQLRGMLKSVQTVATPKFAAQGFEQVTGPLKKKLIYFSCFTAAISIVYILCAPWLYKFALPNYLHSIIYSQLYALSLVFAAPSSLLYTLFISQGLKQKITLFNLITYSLQIILLIVGSLWFGIYGTVAARILTFIGMFVLTIWLTFKHKKNDAY